MKSKHLLWLLISSLAFAASAALADPADPERDILVTFENDGSRATTIGAPYRARKRYAISRHVRRLSAEVERQYGLRPVDHWPIRSLSVYCFVYRVPDNQDRDAVIERLREDRRVESAQAVHVFDTNSRKADVYDDTYAGLQHGLNTLNLTQAHLYSRGQGIRIAVIDSNVDAHHEDLRGRIRSIDDFAPSGTVPDRRHGTAVTSVIVAHANNAIGIVGVAPEASLDLYVACWSEGDGDGAICDSFALAKAMDSLLEKPPDVLNLSLTGPYDPLLERLLRAAHQQGVVLVGASSDDRESSFPSSMEEVIAVRSGPTSVVDGRSIVAPGERILVALPDDAYDFQSGSSLAAAHVSGVVALLLSVSPDTGSAVVWKILDSAQSAIEGGQSSLDACKALQFAEPSLSCEG